MLTDRLPPMPDAYSVWLRARSAVTSAHYPRRIDYTIAVSGLDGQTPAVDHYRASCDPGEVAVRLFPISDEQLAKPPPVPHGVNVNIVLSICIARGGCGGYSVPLGHPAPNQDLLGEPLLTPTYMFGLRYHESASTAQPSGETALPVIATVSAQSPDYRVEMIDAPALDGVQSYHLRLTPLRKPGANRLRELWIGANDYLPRRAYISGNFTLAPLDDVPWTVDFTVAGGVPYVLRETAADALFLGHHRVVRQATIAFQDIREPDGSLYDRPLVEPASTATTLVEPDN